MTADVGAVADGAAGTPVGQARPHGHTAEDALCLNCGTRLIDEYCHACGQSGHVHRSLGAIGHEIAHGVFHFEGKIWQTLPLLILHPGTLTRRYVNGERVRFVSPLALFLFTVFLMFATIAAVGGEMSEDAIHNDLPGHDLNYARESAKARAMLDRVVAQRAEAVRAGSTYQGPSLVKLDEQAAMLRTTLRAFTMAANTRAGGDIVPTEDLERFKTGWARLDHGIAKANANPGLMIYKLQTSAYKYSWGLIPLSVPFMALLFLWRGHYALYDHAIFVTYSIAFMMLLVIALILARTAGVAAGLVVLAALLVPPIHMFAQLRGAYALGKFSAAWRTIALLTFAFTVLTAFIVLLLLHGLTD